MVLQHEFAEDRLLVEMYALFLELIVSTAAKNGHLGSHTPLFDQPFASIR